MILRRRAASLLFPLLLGSLGCAGLGSAPKTTDEAAALRRDLLEARQRAVMAEVESERLASEVAELERQLEEARSRSREAPPARPGAPVVDDVTSIDLGGEIEEMELEEPRPRPTAPSAAPSTAASSQGATASSSESAQALYDQAYAFFHEKRYAEAERGFRHFLELYSDSHLADNAHFWIGECRWARGDFSSALAEFSATVDRYPNGNKVPDALLKAGRCLEALGQMPQAVATYRELITRFAGSVAALTAQQRLTELGE